LIGEYHVRKKHAMEFGSQRKLPGRSACLTRKKASGSAATEQDLVGGKSQTNTISAPVEEVKWTISSACKLLKKTKLFSENSRKNEVCSNSGGGQPSNQGKTVDRVRRRGERRVGTTWKSSSE